jgi:hypothetical protein
MSSIIFFLHSSVVIPEYFPAIPSFFLSCRWLFEGEVVLNPPPHVLLVTEVHIITTLYQRSGQRFICYDPDIMPNTGTLTSVFTYTAYLLSSGFTATATQAAGVQVLLSLS